MRTQESAAGIHFLNCYQSCMRSWYLKYGIGLRPQYTGKALLFGTAFHAACEEYYLKFCGMTEFIAKWKGVLEELRPKFQNSYDFFDALDKAEHMGRAWYERNANRCISVIEVEKEHLVPLADGYYMTVRPDAVLMLEPGLVVTMEHKSTSYSYDAMVNNVRIGDQALVQNLAVMATLPDTTRYRGVVPDVVYMKGNVTKADWGSPVMHTRDEFIRFIEGASGLLAEITQKYHAWTEGWPEERLFPRNGSTCQKYGCEYESICRSRICRGDVLPGFEWEPLEGEPTGIERNGADVLDQ